MITCFDNLIGVRDLAGKEDPDSGYFINDLPGITTQKIEDISDDEDHYEPRLAFDDILNRSIRQMETDTKTHLKPYYKNYNYRFNSTTGRVDVDNTTLPTGNFYNGWHLDHVGSSPDLSIIFETITLNIVSGTSFTVKIFDAITGDELESFVFTVTAGLSTYRLLITIPLWKHRKLFVAYDANDITVKKIDRFDRNLGSVRAGQVSTGASVVDDNITSANTGMMLSYNVECSIDNFVCQRVDLFKDPFLYKLGIEFCNEVIHSSRINR